MSTKKLITETIDEHLSTIKSLKKNITVIEDCCAKINQTILKKNKILLCGNGGSAADAQHIAAEFTGRFLKERMPLPAIALSTDSSALTAIGNDYGFDKIFSRQLSALYNPGDLLIGISTSGNSKNVIKAIELINEFGGESICLLGNDGGEIKNICKNSIIIESSVTARIQEAHILIGHIFCQSVDILF